MTELRAAIIRLFEQGNSGEKIGKMLDVPARTAREVIKRFKETGSYEDRPRSGRPRTARTPVNKRKIKGRIQRNPNSRKNSTRKMAKAIGISEGSVRNILHKDLGMSARKLVKAHGLTEKGKEKRLIRCKRLVFLSFDQLFPDLREDSPAGDTDSSSLPTKNGSTSSKATTTKTIDIGQKNPCHSKNGSWRRPKSRSKSWSGRGLDTVSRLRCFSSRWASR